MTKLCLFNVKVYQSFYYQPQSCIITIGYVFV